MVIPGQTFINNNTKNGYTFNLFNTFFIYANWYIMF